MLEFTVDIISIYLCASVVTIIVYIWTVYVSYKTYNRSNSLHILRSQADSKAKYETNTMCPV
jgi:cell division protein FtsL